MDVTLLGTGSPMIDPNRAGPSTLVQASGSVFLVDCGQSMSRSISLRGSKDAGVSHRGVDLALHLIETSLRNTCVGGRRAAHRPLLKSDTWCASSPRA